MAHIIQTKQASRASGGRQYYIQALEPQTKAFLRKVGACSVWLGTPYGLVTTGLMLVAGDKVLEEGKLRAGRVGHDRLQKQQAEYSVEEAIKHWFVLKTTAQLYKLDCRERTFHSRVTGRDAVVLLPEKAEIPRGKTQKLHLDLQPLTFTRNHQSLLMVRQLEHLARDARDSLTWAREQIGRVLNDHFVRKVAHVGEEDILRVSGALNRLGIQLDAYRKKGYDCFESEFAFLEFPVYRCPVEIKKRSSGFDYQVLKRTSPERAAVLCLEHDQGFVPPDAVDIIELKALHNFLST